MTQGPPRALKILVVTLGVLLIGAVGVFVWGVTRNLGGGSATGGPFWVRALDLPAGHAIVGVTVVGDALAVHVNAGAGREERVIIVDPRNGRIVGTIQGQRTP